MANHRFTPVRQRIVDAIKSGAPTSKEDVWKCLYDDEGPLTNVHPHLSYLRTRLKPGYEIICQLIGHKTFYRVIRTVEGEDPFD